MAIVPVDQVVAHETVDERRSALLVEQIRAVGLLRNPPVVTRVDDRYIVLDGATRSAAMRALDIPHLAVQEVNVDEHLGLETWHHVVRDVTATALLQTLGAVDEIRLEEEQPGAAVVRNIEYGAIASVTTVDGRAFLVHAEPGVNRFDALGAFAASYMSAASVSRTLERNLRTLASWHPGMVALIEYPEFTVQQVLDAAASGRLLPAGVTRFAIPGRVLRLDLPLEILVSDQTLEAKNAWLQDQLAEKERQGRIRYYGEPVYVLDE